MPDKKLTKNKDKKLEKVKALLKMVDESLTREEFLKNIEKIARFVKAIELRNEKTNKDNLEELTSKFEKLSSEFISKIETENEGTTKKLNDDIKKSITDIISATNIKSKQIDDKLAAVRDGVDGRDADEKKLFKKLKKAIPKTKDIKKEIPDMGVEIRDALELLEGKERLDVDAISGLKEKLKKLEGKIPKKSGFGVGPVNQVQYADLTSQCDGVTKSFEVPRHRHAVMLTGTQYPIIYRPVIDYTTANKTLTLTSEVSAPELSQTLTFLYIK